MNGSPVPMFRPLPRPGRTLRRPRLLARLDSVPRQTMTLVCGPPGAGKTTLVTDWMQTRRDVTFLDFAFDERINEPRRWATVLREALAGFGLVDDTARCPDTAAPLIALADELAKAGAPRTDVVIVTDDAHELTDASVWREFHHLIAGAPPWLRWVVISRADPAFGLRRLRIDDRVAEIRAADLAFDFDETRQLLQSFGLSASDADVAHLAAWSEGWAAALCLAARAMGHDGAVARWRHLEASERLVVDFLVEEVLDKVSVLDRNFLLQVSAADEFTPELASALTGRADAATRLHRLAQSGAFLLEVDESGRTYRFHGLMSTLLRARLRDASPLDAQRLTRRAALWYAKHDAPVQAERHALRSEAWGLVADLRVQRATECLLHTGTFPTNETTVPGHGAQQVSTRLLGGVGAISSGDRRSAIEVLEPVGLLDPERFGAPAAVLSGLAEIERGRWVTARERTWAATDMLRALPQRSDVPDELGWYLAEREGELHLASDQPAAASACFDEIISAVHAPQWAMDDARILRAISEAALGRPAQALRICAETPPRTGDAASWFILTSALLHGLRGNRAGMRQRLDGIRSTALPRSSLFESCLAPLRAAAASTSPAMSPVDRPAEGLPTRVAVSVGLLDGIDRRGQPWMIGGDLEGAIVRARRALAASSRAVLDVLQPWEECSLDDQHPRTTVELCTLLGAANLRTGSEDLALRWIERSIAVAAATSATGPLVWAPSEVARLIERRAWELGERNPAAVDVLDAVRATHPRQIAPLTDRERAVLKYLPTLMSNDEIAEQMLLSVNTVKTHLKSIYRKLGVERRRDALLRARQVELL